MSKIITIFVLLLVCFVFNTNHSNATGLEDLLPSRSKSIALNDGGFIIEIMKKEIWKYIDNSENLYMVSNKGRVKSLSRNVWMIINNADSIRKGRILKTRNVRGYEHFTVSIKGVYKARSVHRCLATAFIPNPENKPHINHINGIKTDNRIENLEWCTPRENSLHAHKIGLSAKNNFKRKLTEPIVQEIRINSKDMSQDQLAKKHNVSRRTIGRVMQRLSWKHI